jgi:hypothetical protein
VVDIGRLLTKMESARDRAEDALKLEMEAAARFRQNPAAFDNWQEAKAKSKRADAEFESALLTYLEAARRFGRGMHRPKS